MKPCPFCGSTNIGVWGESAIGCFYRWVRCRDCFAHGPQASRAHYQDYDGTERAAIEKWNERIEE